MSKAPARANKPAPKAKKASAAKPTKGGQDVNQRAKSIVDEIAQRTEFPRS